MPVIEVTTVIDAPLERCFDLARSIDLHKLSTEGTNEQAVDGVTAGLIGYGQQVTWRARHFGVTQKLTSKITGFRYPWYFRDEMMKGAFQKITHDHLFLKEGDKTLMKDVFEFESPGGLVGLILNKLVLTGYLRKLIIRRNKIIKEVAESEQWKTILNR